MPKQILHRQIVENPSVLTESIKEKMDIYHILGDLHYIL